MQLLTLSCFLVQLLLFTGASGLVWNNNSLADGATVDLHEWQDLEMDWSYSLEPGEWLLGARWLLMLSHTRHHTLASQDGTLPGQPFFVRKFYWGQVRQINNAGIFLSDPTHRTTEGVVTVLVDTVTGSKSCCPYPPSRTFKRQATYVVTGPASKTEAEERADAERERMRAAFSSLYPASRVQLADCRWCLQPWRRLSIVHTASAAAAAAGDGCTGFALQVVVLVHLSLARL